jgi:hypothetical protein
VKRGGCPTGKRGYFGQLAAERALAAIQQRDPDGPCRAYRCDLCPLWHVTRETGAQRRHRGTWQAKRAEGMR